MKDFNDLHKADLITRGQLLETLRKPSHRPGATRRERGDTFLDWCKAQLLGRNIQIGHVAYQVLKDKERPKGGAPSREAWEEHWMKTKKAEQLPLLRAAWAEWAAWAKWANEPPTANEFQFEGNSYEQ
jgi:hypothetical protein